MNGCLKTVGTVVWRPLEGLFSGNGRVQAEAFGRMVLRQLDESFGDGWKSYLETAGNVVWRQLEGSFGHDAWWQLLYRTSARCILCSHVLPWLVVQ